jgi:hypothetical protein
MNTICYLHHPYPEVDGSLSLVHISSLENPAFCDRLSVSHSAFKFFTFFFFCCVALLVRLAAEELKEYFDIWRLHDGLGLFLPL